VIDATLTIAMNSSKSFSAQIALEWEWKWVDVPRSPLLCGPKSGAAAATA